MPGVKGRNYILEEGINWFGPKPGVTVSKMRMNVLYVEFQRVTRTILQYCEDVSAIQDECATV